jgi:hypothetical protein
MKNKYDKEMIIYTIEAVENLGIDGFHWEERDEQFRKSQDELKQSVDKIIVCLEWLDEYLNYFTYFSNYNCYASDVREMIETPDTGRISLGCVIAAVMYNYQKLQHEKEIGNKDLVFRIPSTERDRLEIKKRIIYEL